MEKLYWNNDWKFAETWEEAMKEAVYPENEMEDVRLPHTCKELPYHYFDEHAYQMLCGDILWRRKRGRAKVWN
jgi:beta-galactosidase